MKRGIKRVSLVTGLVICLPLVPILFPPSPAFAGATTTVSIITPSQVDTGEQFTVEIIIQPAADIAGAQFDLTVNTSLVTINDIKEGQFLSQNGSSTYFRKGTIDSTTGIISGVAGAILTPGQTVSTEGTFAIITLTAGTEHGNCALTLSNVILADINANSVPISLFNSQIAIGFNQSPILNPIGDKIAIKGESISFTISATDIDGDSLIYSASNLPRGAFFDPSTQTFTWTPRNNQRGTYSGIQFSVSDGNLSDSEYIEITVNNKETTNNGKRKKPPK